MNKLEDIIYDCLDILQERYEKMRKNKSITVIIINVINLD